MNHFNLGDVLRDKITGFAGVAMSRHAFISGTVQYGILSRERNDKGEDRQAIIDWQSLELITPIKPVPEMPDLPAFDLGDQVEDSLTDFKGTVTSKSEFIHGCVQYGVQPRALGKDGDIIKPRLIDCQRLKLRVKVEGLNVAGGGGPELMPV